MLVFPNCSLELTVYGPDKDEGGLWDIGNRDKLYSYKQDAHSFVRNHFMHQVCQAFDADSLGQTTYGEGKLVFAHYPGGSDNAINGSHDIGSGGGSANSGFRGAINNSSHGIVAGTGTGAFAFADAVLSNDIVEGTGDGLFNHVDMVDHTLNPDPPYSGDKWTVTYNRFFNNNGSTQIVVAELGLATKNISNVFNLHCRDKLGSTINIDAGGQLKATYTLVSPVHPV